ncbi:UNVERIFIED_CONTAM: Carbamoyl-phosphate synthase small chain, chloroplastic [Sesamum calycinum]|uniref:carbamoyl-phosphate synthase (glutamine-hydrolyzing) n=1 Tax=Sesamum calycinum TaxID=2727403 RepID=A0AAW2MPP6_9LAMI
MKYALGMAVTQFPSCFTLNSPKVRLFTVNCQSVSPAASGSSSTGLVEKPWKVSDARLVLEDGSVWRAKSFGASGTQVGEVVFNTSLTGYQEILTDPSYAGQFVLMTNPHIGNTGVNFAPQIGDAQKHLESIWHQNIMGIYDVDTRAITRRLREDGSLIGVLSTEESKTDEELLKVSRTWDIVGVDLISGVTCKAPYEWVDRTGSEWEFNLNEEMKRLFKLVSHVEYYCSEDNCLQIWGGKTFKMKFGHHGGNHPVRNIRNGRVEISAQNHNYAVDPESLPEGVEVTHVNLNDGSCAGLAFPQQKLMSLQYHPEASPGPHDSDLVFGEFIELMKQERQRT